MDHVREDLGAVKLQLSPDIVAALEALINQDTVTGAGYNAQSSSEVDTEVF